jgi:hypothetical protein
VEPGTEQLSALTQLHTISLKVPSPPPEGLLLSLCGLPALQELQLQVCFPPSVRCRGAGGRYSDVTDVDLLYLVTLRERLTRLSLGGLHCVSPCGVAALVGGLTNLQRLELLMPKAVFGEEAGGVLVEALLPCLSCLSSLRLVGLSKAGAVRGRLASVVEARGCSLELV